MSRVWRVRLRARVDGLTLAAERELAHLRGAQRELARLAATTGPPVQQGGWLPPQPHHAQMQYSQPPHAPPPYTHLPPPVPGLWSPEGGDEGDAAYAAMLSGQRGA